jgi:hypothetical protein
LPDGLPVALSSFASCRNPLFAVARVRVIAQPLWTAAAALRGECSKHVRHALRVVAGTRHQLHAENVGLALVLTAELHEVGADAEVRSLRDDAAGGAADDRAEHLASNRADLVLRGFGRLCGAVAQQDVTQLVGHHACDFAFVTRRFDHPAVHEHRPAWECERVDFLLVDDTERVAEFGMLILAGNHPDKTLSDTREVLLDGRIVQQRQFFWTCCAASCPSFTSSAGLYLFGVGATMCVCADAEPSATVSSRIGSKRPWWRKVDMAELMARCSAMTLPIAFLPRAINTLIPQDQPRRQAPEAQLRSPYCDRSGRVVGEILEMAELESRARTGRHESDDPAADIESKQVALGIEQVHLRAEARMHQPDTCHDIRPK